MFSKFLLTTMGSDDCKTYVKITKKIYHFVSSKKKITC